MPVRLNFYLMLSNRVIGTSHTKAARYSLDSNTWETLADLKHGRSDTPSIFVVNTTYAHDPNSPQYRLYVVGGEEDPSTSMEYNDITVSPWAMDRWNRESLHLPYGVIYTEAINVNNTAYICSGNDTTHRKSVISWSPTQSVWTYKANMSIFRYNHHCTVSDKNNSIWVIAGCEADECWDHGFVEHYSVSKNIWTSSNTHPPVLERRKWWPQVCAYWDGHIYAVFSAQQYTVKRSLNPYFFIYNTASDEWARSSTKLNTEVIAQMFALVPS